MAEDGEEWYSYLIPDALVDTLQQIENFIADKLGDMLINISKIITFITKPVAAMVDWLYDIWGWISLGWEYLFMVVLFGEVAVVMYSLRSGNFFENMIYLNVRFFGFLSKIIWEVVKLFWKIISDTFKILSNLVPFT